MLQPWAAPAGDVAAAGATAITFTLMLLHKFRWLVFRRLFLIAGFCYGLRAVVLAGESLIPGQRGELRQEAWVQ